MTIKQAKAELKPLGITLVSKPWTGEFRVNYAVDGREATAVYATDLDDAVATGKAMAEWMGRLFHQTDNPTGV